MRKHAPTLAASLFVAASLASLPAQARSDAPRVVPGRATAAPSFVTAIREPARRGAPVDAALAHLRANQDRYAIPHPERDLDVEQVHPGGGFVSVRFAQRHGGVRVFGGQYIVHLRRSDVGLAAEAANGDYFTALDVPTTPKLDSATAALLARVAARPVAAARVDDNGLTVLPIGGGVLAHHFTVWGTRFGAPAKREVFVNAHTGRVVLSYDNLQSDGPVVGNGTTAHGRTVELNVFQRGDIFEMRDRGRAMLVGAGGEIRTHDARGASIYLATDHNIVTSPTSTFAGEDTDSGAVDAHYNAGKVYEYFLSLGRNSIDGRGMSIVSTVNTSENGRPMFNAFWDGKQMVYGNPDPANLYPLSADLDVVGHELTHGVTQHSANLVYLNQSGAMNEAYSDYFGEAIDVEFSLGGDMNHPDAGLIGEDLCRTQNVHPRVWQCPLRDLDDPRKTDDHIYYLADFDSGGVHLNSAVYAGALWDIREALGGEKADRYVYTALTRFTTPLDDFVDGRNSVVAAAQSLGATADDIAAINRAFDERGIVPGWDQRGGNDATILVPNVAPVGRFFSPPRVDGERFVIGDYKNKEDICCKPLQIFVGRLDGSGRLRKVGEDADPETYNDETPDISGKRAVWAHTTLTGDGLDIDVHSRRLGGRVRNVAGGPGFQWYPSIDGDVVAWEHLTRTGADIKARRLGGRVKSVVGAPGEQWMPQVSGDWVAWWDVGDPTSATSVPKIGLKNLATGKRITIGPPGGSTSAAFVGPPGLGPDHVYWYQDRDGDGVGSIMRARLGSTKHTAVVKENIPETSPVWIGVTSPPVVAANARFATYHDEFGYAVEFGGNPDAMANGDVGRDVWIVSVSGGVPRRVTSNRGDQAFPGIGAGARVVWLDSSQGRTDLMTKVVR